MWAFCYPLAKILLTTLSPIALTAWRCLLAGLIILPFLRRRDFPAKWQPFDLLLMATMGVIGCAVASSLQYFGTHFTLSANVVLIVGLEPLMTNLLAVIFLGDRMNARQVAAFALALLGVYVVSVDPGVARLDLFSSQYLVGNLLALASVIAYAVYTIAAKPLVGRFSAWAITGIPFLMAAVATLIFFAFADPSGLRRAFMLEPKEVAGLIFIAFFATVVGYTIWNWLLRFVPVSRLTYSIFAQPPAGAFFSVLLLGETLSARFYIGTAFIIIAMILGQSQERVAIVV